MMDEQEVEKILKNLRELNKHTLKEWRIDTRNGECYVLNPHQEAPEFKVNYKSYKDIYEICMRDPEKRLNEKIWETKYLNISAEQVVKKINEKTKFLV